MAKTAKAQPFDARAYMQLAIEEMNKSKNEPRPDGKVPPLVGAVLLSANGEVLGAAHRGELREGDHAEYTLLERKLGGEKLDDCILFTTLEPCVERNSPKVPCCRRTSNARIKTVYVGIADPDPTVDGKGIRHLEKHGCKVLMFDRDLQKIIESKNKKFIEQAIERKNSAEEEVIEVTSLELPVVTADFGEFSAEALQKFITAAKLKYKLESPEFQKYLSTLGVLAVDKNTNSYKPTGVGILLFGQNPRLSYKQAALKAHVDYGGDKIEPVTFDQPLVLVPDLVEEWLRKVIPLSKNTSSFKRTDVPDFPIEVLREAIINGLVHRSFDNEGAKVSLEIDNEKIIIKSPGAPLPSISLDQLNTFKAPSISRNPIITYVFNLMGYVEETGFGMRALRSLNEKYSFPLPEYAYKNPFLVLTFPRNLKAVKTVSQHAGVASLNNEELQGYEFIKLKEKAKRKEYEDYFRFDKKKAERHLNKMVEEGLIERKGSGPGTYYQIAT